MGAAAQLRPPVGREFGHPPQWHRKLVGRHAGHRAGHEGHDALADRLGKNRLGKNRLGKNRLGERGLRGDRFRPATGRLERSDSGPVGSATSGTSGVMAS